MWYNLGMELASFNTTELLSSEFIKKHPAVVDIYIPQNVLQKLFPCSEDEIRDDKENKVNQYLGNKYGFILNFHPVEEYSLDNAWRRNGIWDALNDMRWMLESSDPRKARVPIVLLGDESVGNIGDARFGGYINMIGGKPALKFETTDTIGDINEDRVPIDKIIAFLHTLDPNNGFFKENIARWWSKENYLRGIIRDFYEPILVYLIGRYEYDVVEAFFKNGGGAVLYVKLLQNSINDILSNKLREDTESEEYSVGQYFTIVMKMLERITDPQELIKHLSWSFLKKEFYELVFPEQRMRERAESGVNVDTIMDLDVFDLAYNSIEELKKSSDGGISVLDVGCGWGRFTIPLAEKYPDLNITGFDFQVDAARRELQKVNSNKREHIQVDFREGDFMQPFDEIAPPDSKDIVTATWHTVTEAHGLWGMHKLFLNVRRVLKKGGIFMFDIPHRSNYSGLIDNEGNYKREIKIPESLIDDFINNNNNNIERGGELEKEFRDYLEHIGYYRTYWPTVREVRFLLLLTGFEIVEKIEKRIDKKSDQFPDGFEKTYFIVKKV